MRTVAVDFGGTLAPKSAASPDGTLVARVLMREGLKANLSSVAHAFEQVRAQATCQEQYRNTQTPFAALLRETATQCGGRLANPAAAARSVFEQLPDGVVPASATVALRQLQAQGWQLVLACNTQRPGELRRRTLAAAGVAECFAALVISSELGLRKPHPGFYRAVARAAGVPAGRVVFVGDTPEKDVWGPRRCGMESVWLSRSNATGLTGVPVIREFAALPAALEDRHG